MALELSDKKWRLAFSDGKRKLQKVIDAGSVAALCEQIRLTKQRWALAESAAVVSCDQAGRDGFWLHRELEALGVENHVVDAASIEVSRLGGAGHMKASLQREWRPLVSLETHCTTCAHFAILPPTVPLIRKRSFTTWPIYQHRIMYTPLPL